MLHHKGAVISRTRSDVAQHKLLSCVEVVPPFTRVAALTRGQQHPCTRGEVLGLVLII